MANNPFDELGLKKDVIQTLRERGKLDNYLKGYMRFSQLHLHPDRGGDGELSSRINSAYDEICRHPENVETWLSSMQNGSNPEHLTLIDALAAEVERLRGVEKEYATLQKKYAASLTGEGATARVRTPPRAVDSEPVRTRRAPATGPATPRRPAAAHTAPRAAPAETAVYAGYGLMPRADTYADGVDALREDLKLSPAAHPVFVKEDGGTIYRPLTFKETIKARVENYEKTHNADGTERTMDDRLYLITVRWNDSCTAVAYKAGTTNFKIIPQSQDLITIQVDFKEAFMDVSYRSLSGANLNSTDGKYGVWLTKAEVLEHPAWIAAVEGDTPLLTAYSDIIFAQLKSTYKRTIGMAFYVRQNTEKDELRALLVNDLIYYSNAIGNNILNDNGSFLRVAHR